MIDLCLAVFSSALIAIIMRLSTGRIRYNLGMLTMNYIVCALLAGIFGGFRGAFDLSDPLTGAILAMGSVNGVLYLAGFLLMQMNIRKNGVVLSSIFQKLGLLVTLVVSVVFYREIPEDARRSPLILMIRYLFLKTENTQFTQERSRENV